MARMMILLLLLPIAKGLRMPARGVPQMTSTKYERTFVRPPARRFMSARGIGGLAARGLSAATLALSVRAIVADAAKPLAAAAFRTWTEFGRVAGIWFAANAALFFSLGARRRDRWPGVDAAAERFKDYPLFTWVVPALQQLLFFVPASAHLAAAAAGRAAPSRAAVHAVAGLFGMQARDLVLIDSDYLMTCHHVLTMAICLLIWRGVSRSPFDAPWAAAVALCACAVEAGSLGTNVWNFFGSKAAFFGLVTLSHVVGLGAGYTVLARRAPWELWTVLVAAAPLIVQRQAYVRSELRRGAPSGEFGD